MVHARATWLLDEVIADTPLSKALRDTFNSYNSTQKLLSLAYFKILEPEKAMYLYEDFALATRLPYHRPLDIGCITTQVLQLSLKIFILQRVSYFNL